jgi:hypothetical protein
MSEWQHEREQEHAAAVDAAQRVLFGPTVAVPHALLKALVAELEVARRLVQHVLAEGSAQPASDDDQTRE